MKSRELHLRISRLVIDSESGADRAALVRALAGQLPAAIAARLSTSPASSAAPTTLQERIADAVAPRVTEHVERQS